MTAPAPRPIATRPPTRAERVNAVLAARGLLDGAAAVALAHYATAEEVFSGFRDTRVVQARDAVLLHLVEHPKACLSASGVARLTGIDHTTVMTAVKRARARRAADAGAA